MELHVFDFDGSITSQNLMLKDFENFLTVHDMKHYRYKARLWASPSCFSELSRDLDQSIPNRFSLIGSGDYHHISLALIAQYDTPLTVLLFDNHPDWMRPPHQYHCGTWVYSLARLPHVKRVIIIGLESGDIDSKHFQKGDMESLENGKIILFPYQPAIVKGKQTVTLKNHLQQDIQVGSKEILQYIATEHVYISVDKDCLRTEDAYTNWEQGSMPLSTVTAVIKYVGSQKTILGGDTVGDFSAPSFRSPLKCVASYLDRRVFKKTSNQNDLNKNMNANRQLIEAFEACYA